MKRLNGKKILAYILFLCIAILGNFAFVNGISADKSEEEVNSLEINLSLKSEMKIAAILQLFYSETKEFGEEKSLSVLYDKYGEFQEINYEIDSVCKFIRLDFGAEENIFEISQLMLQCGDIEIDLMNMIGANEVDKNMLLTTPSDQGITASAIGNDAYIIFDIEKIGLDEIIKNRSSEIAIKKRVLICTVWNLIFFIAWLKRGKIAKLFGSMFCDKGLLLDLAKNDFKTKFAGSYLGITWAFIQPIVTILVYWFVFQVGFKSGTVQDVPFVLWLTAGLVPWFFLNDALNSATASLLEYSYLVKKVVFNIEIIPLVRIVSSFFVHIFFVAFMLVMFIINGIMPKLEWIQIIYYSICLFSLIVGVSYLTSALVVFFRDLAQIIIIILQIGMWITPIMWQWSIMPPNVLLFIKLNPVYYIVEGYRNSLIYGGIFWNDTYMTVYFWIFVLLSLVLGAKVFSKLKVHFADML